MYGYLEAWLGKRLAPWACAVWFVTLILMVGYCFSESPGPFGYNGR